MTDSRQVVTIIQARMCSTRLPGKVMMDISGKPVLWHVVDRVKRAKQSGTAVIATTDEAEDQVIVDFAAKDGIPVSRGSQDDVLDRYYRAAQAFQADPIVRVTADCPLLDPDIFDEVVNFYFKDNYDFVSNTHPPTFPDGLDTEVFSFKALERAWHEAQLHSEREHVTPYLYNHPEIFRLGNVTCSEDLSNLRCTVDEPRDLEFARAVFQRLGMSFGMAQVLNLLREVPELENLNAGIERDAGYKKSLREDGLSEANK